MPPLFDAEVVSPELALVDPELGTRARASLPPRRGRRVPASPLRAVAVAPAPRRGRRLATPALTVVATAAASTIVTAFTSFEQAQGEPPRAVVAAEVATPLTARAPAGSPAVASAQPPSDAAAAASPPSSSTSDGRADAAGERTQATPQTSPTVRNVAAPDATAPAPAPSGTTLVWDDAARATAYDIELRRGGAVIYASTSTAPQAFVPRSWQRDGTAFELRPEDRLYVWPVIGGSRARPIVGGAPAMDTTDIARFTELSQTSRR
jgi:hypothetical protein